MSQILIAGATGLVGQALIRQLGTEHQLTLLCRQPGEAAPNRHWLPVDFERVTAPRRKRRGFPLLRPLLPNWQIDAGLHG